MAYINFYSGAKAPYYKLSNLFHAPVKITSSADLPTYWQHSAPLRSLLASGGDGPLYFASIEQVWHAFKALDRQTFLRFTNTGDLGQLDPNVFTDTKTNMVHWKKKNMIGIAAKLASNPTHGAALGLGPNKMDYGRENLGLAMEQTIWLELLMLKFRQNPLLAQILLATGSTQLIELDRGAQRRAVNGHAPVHWGGYKDDNGVLWGDNAISGYLISTRTALRLLNQ